MTIISWNVNGIRAWSKKGYFDWFLKENPDLLCIQETKAEQEQLSPEIQKPQGYYAYFDHSKGRKGYSGVAIYSKVAAEKVEYGMGVPELDQEGRAISLHFKDVVVINTYFPNGGGGPIRLKYKLDYYKAFLKYADKIRKKGKSVIFVGDINTAHSEVDLARPKENANNTGFLPIERKWLDEVVKAGYVDTFRNLHPNTKDAYSYWDMKTFARERNVGWRIDYIFVSEDIKDKVKEAGIMDKVLGSDHCPIFVNAEIKLA